VHTPSDSNPHEHTVLRLDSTRARSQLGWRPRWSLQQALEQTVAWHQAWLRKADMQQVSRQQIAAYSDGRA
jgi:CDP-glucose 4,6-dehydratase